MKAPDGKIPVRRSFFPRCAEAPRLFSGRGLCRRPKPLSAGAGSFLPLQAGVRRQGQQPLELGPPSYEETLKHDCAGSSSCCSRASSETASPAPAADTASSDTGSGADQAEETTQTPQTASAGAGSAELLDTLSRLGNL